MKRKSIKDYRKKAQEPHKPRLVFGLKEVAAHELGHVIAHIVTERYFDWVWIRGVNEGWDRHYDKQGEGKMYAGCVTSYRRGGMKFDGKRVKSIEQDLDAESYLIMSLGGVAAEEVFAGRETPRSIIEVSNDYRLRESATDCYGDFRQAQKWVKHGVEEGYFYAKEVWGVLQHYYNAAFWAVRSHKEFLLAAIPLLVAKGWMDNKAILTLWNGYYQITAEKKASKKVSLLDVKDNASTQEETDMKFTVSAEIKKVQDAVSTERLALVQREVVVKRKEDALQVYTDKSLVAQAFDYLSNLVRRMKSWEPTEFFDHEIPKSPWLWRTWWAEDKAKNWCAWEISIAAKPREKQILEIAGDLHVHGGCIQHQREKIDLSPERKEFLEARMRYMNADQEVFVINRSMTDYCRLQPHPMPAGPVDYEFAARRNATTKALVEGLPEYL